MVVAYDIRDGLRRTRVHKVLKNFGRPVQYSTFECYLSPFQFALLHRTIRRLIRPRADQLACYGLCQICEEQTEVLSGVPKLKPNRIVLV